MVVVVLSAQVVVVCRACGCGVVVSSSLVADPSFFSMTIGSSHTRRAQEGRRRRRRDS